MRTELNIVVERSTGGQVVVYCNDPQANVHFVKSGTMKHCGQCEHEHPKAFGGDCRDDNHRYVEVGSNAQVGDMPRNDYGLKRTECSCPRCSRFCKKMSGYLAPPDLDRMRMALGGMDLISFGLKYLMASPGATVGFRGPDGQVYKIRIHTLVPRRLEDGSCVFLQEDGMCLIHEDSPFGCAMTDEHLTNEENDRRSLLGLQDVAAQHFGGPFFETYLPYEMLLAILSFHGQVAQGPEVARQGL